MFGEGPATVLIQRAGAGDAAAAEELLRVVYGELRQLAAAALSRERAGHTLQPTALVNEAWLRLAGPSAGWSGRGHFFGAAGRAMRQVLVDHARARNAGKRGGGRASVELDESLLAWESRALDLLALDEALAELSRVDERAVRIVELRFFAGLEMAEVARALELSLPTVERGWRMARLWLRARLDPGAAGAAAGGAGPA